MLASGSVIAAHATELSPDEWQSLEIAIPARPALVPLPVQGARVFH